MDPLMTKSLAPAGNKESQFLGSPARSMVAILSYQRPRYLNLIQTKVSYTLQCRRCINLVKPAGYVMHQQV
jgi:hypothetical protein